MGRGVPLLSRLGGLGSVISSPSGVRSRAPAENEFWRIWSLKEHSDKFDIFVAHIFSHGHVHNY